MKKIINKISILLAIIVSMSSCSKHYNLALVKRDNSNQNYAIRDKNMPSIQALSYQVYSNLNEQNEAQLVSEHAMIPSLPSHPIIINKSLEITKGIIKSDDCSPGEAVRDISYYPYINYSLNVQSNQSHNGENKQDFFLYVILAILLPPVCVGLWEGGFTTDFWISILLTICFWIPGVIFALYIILR